MEPQISLSHIREQNRYRVLKQIAISGNVQRSKLARECGVSTMTIKKVVDELLQKGLVRELKVKSEMGRKPFAINFAEPLGCIVCCSLSSKSYIEGAIYDLYGLCVFNHRYPVTIPYMQSLHNTLECLKKEAKSLGLIFIGAGMALPSVYYAKQDKVNNDLIKDFCYLMPKKTLEQYFNNASIVIMQDVQAAAAALYASSTVKSLFYFYLGDGVGGTFINSGNILQGAFCVAGEVGQCVMENGLTLEQAVSVSGLYSKLDIMHNTNSAIEFQAAYYSNENAAAYIDKAAQTAAQVIYNLSWALNPECFIIEATDDFYAQLIVNKANTLATSRKSFAIENPLRVSFASHGQNHALKGIYEQTREQWLWQGARSINLKD